MISVHIFLLQNYFMEYILSIVGLYLDFSSIATAHPNAFQWIPYEMPKKSESMKCEN